LKNLFELKTMHFALGATLVVAGCGSGSGTYTPKPVKPVNASKAPANDATLYFPFKVGNQWTYAIEASHTAGGQTTNAAGEVTLRVSKVTPSGDGVIAEIEVLNAAGKSDQTQTWKANSRGIYQLASGSDEMTYNPPQPALVTPLEAGSTFKWTGTGLTPNGQKGTTNSTSTVLAQQEVDTTSETLLAVPIRSETTFTAGNVKGVSASTAYWAEGVGIVRYRQEVQAGNEIRVQVMKLKAHVLK
jgi:hypothetical protein